MMAEEKMETTVSIIGCEVNDYMDNRIFSRIMIKNNKISAMIIDYTCDEKKAKTVEVIIKDFVNFLSEKKWSEAVIFLLNILRKLSNESNKAWIEIYVKDYSIVIDFHIHF